MTHSSEQHEQSGEQTMPSGTMLPDISAIAEVILAERRIPGATYRLQFNSDFTFRDAQALITYLHDLGISDCYASPILKARAGSTHGYDVCDHRQLNPALGSEQEFDAFTSALRERGMGLIVDVVPNHMGIGDPCNEWWMDVLENGPSSPYASYFDIDWQPVKHELENKVLLPILEDQYGNVLEQGKFRLLYDNGAFAIEYGVSRLPVAPRTSMAILQEQLDRLIMVLDETHEHVIELQSILTALSYLPPRTESDPERVTERLREKEVIKRRIAALYEAGAEARDALDAAIALFNGTVGDPHSFDLLDALITAQPYRPAFWRVAAEEINYRRFFDVNELAAIRVELPEVFMATHQLILQLLAERRVTGLRIDHPDGLWDPPRYFRRLQERYLTDAIQTRLAHGEQRQAGADAAEQVDANALEQAVMDWLEARAQRGATNWPLYVIAEKILSEREPLPPDWAVDGTTGYDFLSAATGLFVDSANERAFDRLYHNFIAGEDWHNQAAFGELVHASKQRIMRSALASEMNSLSHQLARITEKSRRYRDFTLRGITQALREVIACMDVYRTYIAGPQAVSERDRKYISQAVAEARRRNSSIPRAILQFLRDTLLLRNLDQFPAEIRGDVVYLVMKFQQVTGPVMAKSVEDTVFYIYNRLVALNDVGGNPAQFGNSVTEFHRQNAERLRYWPHAMLTLTTHDTKRGEDVRARISVLSELPEEWSAALGRWRALNADKLARLDGRPAPDANDEYLLYQTLVGVWPFEPPASSDAGDRERLSANLAGVRERIVAYMQKATKEAKVHTSWINPDEEYDEAMAQFVRAVLDDTSTNQFLDDLRSFQRRIAYFGQFNSLAQLMLKLTAPGVPDIYQGNELWDFSLVDPDNRRSVDYASRTAALTELRGRIADAGADRIELARELASSYHDGRIKLYVTAATLGFRRDHAQLFAQGDYRLLEALGEQRAHICAFSRTHGQAHILVAVPRLVAGLTRGDDRPPLGSAVWGASWLSLPGAQRGARYRNILTGEIVAVAAYDEGPGITLGSIFKEFPVALLERLDTDH